VTITSGPRRLGTAPARDPPYAILSKPCDAQDYEYRGISIFTVLIEWNRLKSNDERLSF
jgi:hypothetical protein